MPIIIKGRVESRNKSIFHGKGILLFHLLYNDNLKGEESHSTLFLYTYETINVDNYQIQNNAFHLRL